MAKLYNQFQQSSQGILLCDEVTARPNKSTDLVARKKLMTPDKTLS